MISQQFSITFGQRQILSNGSRQQSAPLVCKKNPLSVLTKDTISFGQSNVLAPPVPLPKPAQAFPAPVDFTDPTFVTQAKTMIHVEGEPSKLFVECVEKSLANTLKLLPKKLQRMILENPPKVYVGKTNYDTLEPWVTVSMLKGGDYESLEDMAKKNSNPACYSVSGLIVCAEESVKKLTNKPETLMNNIMFHEVMHFVDEKIGKKLTGKRFSANDDLWKINNQDRIDAGPEETSTWPKKGTKVKKVPNAILDHYFLMTEPEANKHMEAFAECMSYLFGQGVVEPELIEQNYVKTLDYLRNLVAEHFGEYKPPTLANGFIIPALRRTA